MKFDFTHQGFFPPYLIEMRLKTSWTIFGLLVLGAIAVKILVADVVMGDSKTARSVVKQTSVNHFEPGPSIVATEDAKINPAQPGLIDVQDDEMI
jgi:hypothetical protein